MPSKLKAWLKAKLGFGGPVPYKTLAEEEVEVEPVVTYNCDHCGYRSPTQKGLRCHRITVHRIGVGMRRTLDSHGSYFGIKRRKTFPSCSEDAVWTLNFDHHALLGPKLVISESVCIASIQRLFGPNIWSYQSLPGHHQVCSKRSTAVAVWTASLVTSVAAWTPSRVLRVLHCSGCLDYKFSHISRCLHTIKRECLKCCTAIAVWTTSLVTSVAAWTPSSILITVHFSGYLDNMLGHISRYLDSIKCA
ncbi:hypothetical protein TNCT_420801 [Trichonephila clavata]|uniref:Uncharacterized protein n=1 Tax=Trichonephila clavata TaxID=2740835 RepID=A0A8X6JZM0_TRICU|nr:hypothetical protein TNCT_420801 [Trichonephila clavata]